MRERSLSERIEERMQYREALEAKHERQRAEAERQAMLEQERYQRRAMARSMEAAARASAPPKKQRLGEHLCQAANARPAWPTSSATAGAQHHHSLRWRFLL